MLNLPFILSLAPFILFLFLLLWKKTPLLIVSLVTFIFVLILAVFYWQVFPSYVLASSIKGVLIAFDIFIIIFGAIFFLEILKEAKVIENIVFFLESFSKDHRIQVIILAWFFENLIEGTAGFGTPSTIVAPILITIGLTPINAVIVSLLGNSASVAFGAAGTPIRVGFAGLITSSLPLYTALINTVGLLVPVFMLWFITAREKNARQQFFEGLPFALWAGVVFSLPSILTVFLGQEFPSILGAIIGLFLVLLTTKLKIFVPKNVEDPHPFTAPKVYLSIPKMIFPYALLIGLLILGKIILGPLSISVPLIIKHSINLFNPGLAFLLALIPTVIIFRSSRKLIADSFAISIKRSIEPFLVIAFMSAIVQIMINSNNNISSLPSMLEFMSAGIRNHLLPLWAPFVGAFGSFITGSATISNIMFGHFLALAAGQLGFNVSKILALALVGGAAGNMIALADIMAAEAVVGLKNRERDVLKGVIIPCLIYVLLAGIIGILIT